VDSTGTGTACSMASLGYFFIYQQEFSQSVIFIMFESNISEAGEYATQYFAWWIVLAFIAHTAFAVFLWTRLRPSAGLLQNHPGGAGGQCGGSVGLSQVRF
jgi:glucan phosphoethanolaminetransferase (alkaline phosphatase superfamily)